MEQDTMSEPATSATNSAFRLLDSTEAANLLRCQPSTVETAWREGKLPGFRIGLHWRVTESALREGIDEIALANIRAREPQPAPQPKGVLMSMPQKAPVPERRGVRREPPKLPPLPPSAIIPSRKTG